MMIRQHKDSDLKTEIEVLKERIRGIELALALQADEYARRLEELNHAHARAQERNANFLGMEAYEEHRKQLEQWQRAVDSFISESRGSKTSIISMFSAALSIGALSLAMLKILKP
jgi:hypothetical protein